MPKIYFSDFFNVSRETIESDELYLHSLYKKKKAFLVNHLLEVRKKMKLEAERLSNTNIHSDD